MWTVRDGQGGGGGTWDAMLQQDSKKRGFGPKLQLPISQHDGGINLLGGLRGIMVDELLEAAAAAPFGMLRLPLRT